MNGKKYRFRINERRLIMFLLLAASAIIVGGAIVMFLWNSILPDLIHVGQINFLKSIGLLVLCRLLFGSFGGRGGRSSGWGRSSKIDGRFMNMTDEEKAELKEQWRKRCERRDR